MMFVSISESVYIGIMPQSVIFLPELGVENEAADHKQQRQSNLKK